MEIDYQLEIPTYVDFNTQDQESHFWKCIYKYPWPYTAT